MSYIEEERPYKGESMMSNIAKTPAPPYYAVIFTSKRTTGDHGYDAMAEEMLNLASKESGFLGVESAREDIGIGITVSYWDSLEAIQRWKQNERHIIAQRKGKGEWYATYQTRICRVERDYGFDANYPKTV